MNLPTLQADKANHLIYGSMIFAAVTAAAIAVGYPSVAARLGMLAALAAGLIKERLDALGNARAVAAGLPPPHEVSLRDAAFTAAGGVVMWVVGITTGAAYA